MGTNEECPYDDAGWCKLDEVEEQVQGAKSAVTAQAKWQGGGNPDPGELDYILRLRGIARAYKEASTATEWAALVCSGGGESDGLADAAQVTAPDDTKEYVNQTDEPPKEDSFTLVHTWLYNFQVLQVWEVAESADNKEDAHARAFLDYAKAEFEIAE